MFATNPQIDLFASTIVSGDKTEPSCEGPVEGAVEGQMECQIEGQSSLLNNDAEQRCDYDNHQT